MHVLIACLTLNLTLSVTRGPTRRSMGSVRASQPLLGSAASPGNQQWSPDFPASSQGAAEKTHSKFVPMQFRTQPANLPGGLRRQSTNMADTRGESGAGVGNTV